ncbi:MAG TPA: GGDEF domain-containing protein, partial [Saliniramus sp.]|nr:GGDEF domain-containing protein [Saliniramus sp.]
MAPESLMLVAANAIVLFVFAGVFLTAGIGRRSETYWMSWCGGNVALGTALVLFMFATDLPFLAVLILPNLLLLVGFGLRWRAARQFGGRPSPSMVAFAPALLLLCVVIFPLTFGSYRAVFISANSMLFVLAVLIVYEFWRDRADALPSRYGLILAYGLVAVSFFARAIQGIFFDSGMPLLNPDDFRLQVHLAAAIVHSTASGAFALSIAYERNASELRKTAMSDELTGLPNRRAFVARLREAIDAPGGPDFAVTVFDVDHFKQINDQHGHGGGDAVLRACARTFMEALPEDAFFARIGGEEFGAILP